MKVLVCIWGSTGDILPSLAIGRELRRRGHAVDFAANPYFAPLAERAGLRFVAVGERAHHEAMIADADIFGPRRMEPHEVLLRHYCPRVVDYYRVAARAIAGGAQVLLGGEFGSAAAAQAAGVPWIRVAASPAGNSGINSPHDPPHPEWMPRRPLRWLARTPRGLRWYWRLRHGLQGRWRWPAPHLQSLEIAELPAEFRAGLGLAQQFSCKARTTLCMWPAFFAPQQPDWPADMHVCGFPLYPPPEPPLPRAQRRLVVVTSGTVAADQHEFYAKVLAALPPVLQQGFEVLLVSPNRGHIPASLPAGVRHAEHAPFSEIVGRAALVVHHGGIGTASYALAAGVPQLMLPLGGDQYDNANRVQRLGVGRSMSVGGDSAAAIGRTMRWLIESDAVAARCAHWRTQVDATGGVAAAAAHVEALGVAPRSSVGANPALQGVS